MKNLTHLTAMLVILALALSMAACSNGSNSTQGESDTNDPGTDSAIPPEIEHIVNPDESFFDGETLTIAVRSDVLVKPFANRYMRENPGVTIEILSYEEELEKDGNYFHLREQIGTLFMAGSGPVLLDDALMDYHDPRIARYFFDWFPVMRADPNFSEDDWFMNVFHAGSMGGKLLAFPTKFYYEIATANSTISGLPEALAAHEDITITELVKLHRTVTDDVEYYLEPSSGLGYIVRQSLHNYYDLETGWVDFNNAQFINLLIEHKDLLSPDGPIWHGYVVSPSEEKALSERYSFFLADSLNVQYHLDFEESLFVEPTPVVNDNGELQIIPIDAYLLNANATPAQQALAWDFVQFTMQPENYSLPVIGRHPTNRGLLRHVAEKFLPEEIDDFYIRGFGWKLGCTMEEAVEGIIARMTELGEMEMSHLYAYPDVIAAILNENLSHYHDGLVSAEQTAANMQNQFELILMEIGVR